MFSLVFRTSLRYVRSPIFSPRLLQRMLTKARTVLSCQRMALTISARVAPFACLIRSASVFLPLAWTRWCEYRIWIKGELVGWVPFLYGRQNQDGALLSHESTEPVTDTKHLLGSADSKKGRFSFLRSPVELRRDRRECNGDSAAEIQKIFITESTCITDSCAPAGVE